MDIRTSWFKISVFRGMGFDSKIEGEEGTKGYSYSTRGLIESPYGIAQTGSNIYINEFSGRVYQSSFVYFVYQSIARYRWFEKAYKPKYLVTLGRKFIEEVVAAG